MLAGVVFAGILAPAHAQTARIETKVDLRIAPDRSLTKTLEYRTTPLVQGAVAAAAQVRLTVPANRPYQIVKAFTQKADGTIVPADPHDFVTQSGAVGAAASFGDISIQQIAFRDVSVGDTTVLIGRSTESEHYIARQFSQSMSLSLSSAQRSLDVTLHSPPDLDIRHDEQGLNYQETRTGREITRHWSGSEGPSATDEKDLVDLPSVVPGLRFSTFPSYESIATAYYNGAKPKLAVTPEIEQLAAEITANETDVAAQVHAIFDWVSRNIRYVAVYFGNGRVVPNDTHTILSRRFGDCKDHATLLAALLAAKGIASEQALISTDAAYRLPKTPVLQAFNHVILYVPRLNRYLDPTVAFGSFDHLPFRDAGKPVVRVSHRGAMLDRTPELGVEDNVLNLDTHLAITADGRQHAKTTVEGHGEFADQLRTFAAQAEAKGKELTIANLAKLRGLLGTATLDAAPWTDARESYVLNTTWDGQQPLNVVQAGWRAPFALSPLLPGPGLFIGGLTTDKRTYPALCRAGRAINNLDVSLPDGMAPMPLPEPVIQHTPEFSYEEQWSRDGTHVRVRTEITSSIAGRVCTPDQVDAARNAYRAIAAKANPLLHFAWQGGSR
jgi:transglutaminase-like putative cysteine protease